MTINKNEIWFIDFNPSIWNEVKKTRPAIVISDTYYNISSWTIFVIPISSKKSKTIDSPFYINISKNNKNKLDHDSYANISQLRSVSKLRFIKKIWEVEEEIVNELMKKFLSIVKFDVLKLKYVN